MSLSVKDVYLRVIESTIEGSKSEFERKGFAAATLDALDTLHVRWQTLLIKEAEEQDALAEAESAKAKEAAAISADTPATAAAPTVATSGKDAGAAQAGSSIPQNDGADDDDNHDDEDGDNDDDDDDDSDGGPKKKKARLPSDDEDETVGPEPEVNNIILAQHDKVSRKQNRWKVLLKDGVAHINGRDHLFQKASCEFLW